MAQPRGYTYTFLNQTWARVLDFNQRGGRRVVVTPQHPQRPPPHFQLHQRRLGSTPLSPASDMAAAVEAASRAFPAWRSTPAVERARVLFRLKALLDENHEELARCLTKEHGKILPETMGEVKRGIENVEHACGIPTLMMGETLEDMAPGIDCEGIVNLRWPG